MIEKYNNTYLSESSLDHALVVMANTIARKKTKWSVREIKLFLTAVSQIRTIDSQGWVTLNKREIIKKLEMDPSDISKLRKLFKDVAHKSWIEFDGINDDEWEDGFLVNKAKSTRTTVSVQFAKEYLPLLEKLESHFTWFYLDNIAHFNSKHTITLYKYLRSWYDKKYMINHRPIFLTEVKSLFELEPNAYMVKRKDKKTGNVSIVFDVYNFEKYVLNKAVDEINEDVIKSGMSVSYEKIKSRGKTGYVIGYDFAFSLINEDGTRKYYE